MQLCGPLIRIAPTAPSPKPVLEAIRRHADAVTEAVEAHIRDQPLRTYVPLPVNASGAIDVRALTPWPESRSELEA